METHGVLFSLPNPSAEPPVALETPLARHPGALEPSKEAVVTGTVMKELELLVRRVAQVDSTVLITGESGAGKERIAQMVHDESRRASGPFVSVNCGAMTETLLESELFGHVRGAFTGATQDRPGLFQAADGGTLLLDEIGEVSPAMQVKLLRVLQEREIRRVGANRSQHLDVRVIAATNRDLGQAVAAGTFRQDLYYRLNVIQLRVPPLREHREDILPLARWFLAEVSERLKRPTLTLSAEADAQMLKFPWPGNVRELENAMEYAIAVTIGVEIGIDDLPRVLQNVLPAWRPTPSVRPMSEMEQDIILSAMAIHGGNRRLVADQLQISSATLNRRLHRYAYGTDAHGPPRDDAAPAAAAAAPTAKALATP